MRIGPHGYLRRFQATQSSATGFVGALDAFASSLAHVYEPARRTLTSYTGDLVLLRRDSDDAELAFGYDADGNLDTAAIATWAGGASYVVTVYDQKGSDNITQATAGNQPLFTASAQNSKPGMTFDGADTFLAKTMNVMKTAFTIYSIIKPAAVDELGGVVSSVDISFSGSRIASYSDTRANKRAMNYAPDGTDRLIDNLSALSADTPYITSITADGTNIYAYKNKDQQSTIAQAGSTANLDTFEIGRQIAGGFYFNGILTSAIIFEPSLSNGDRLAVEAILNAYWAVY